MSDQSQTNTPNLPFLRALKCAYKLHKAGLTPLEVRCYLTEADKAVSNGDPLPSAATPVRDILPATFNFSDSEIGETFWAAAQRKLDAA